MRRREADADWMLLTDEVGVWGLSELERPFASASALRTSYLARRPAHSVKWLDEFITSDEVRRVHVG